MCCGGCTRPSWLSTQSVTNSWVTGPAGQLGSCYPISMPLSTPLRARPSSPTCGKPQQSAKHTTAAANPRFRMQARACICCAQPHEAQALQQGVGLRPKVLPQLLRGAVHQALWDGKSGEAESPSGRQSGQINSRHNDSPHAQPFHQAGKIGPVSMRPLASTSAPSKQQPILPAASAMSACSAEGTMR